MKFACEDLSHKQFEDLIVFLCQNLLGMSVLGFSEGPDGGRDAKFVGTAALLPSVASPWVGTTIVQAKHTNGFNRSFSESDFFSASSSDTVIGKEIPRINSLVEKKQLNHYMLFANRRLSGTAESSIRLHIATQCGLPEESVYLCGIEQLESWLARFPEVPKLAKLDPLDSPLIVSSEELANVVEALANGKDAIAQAFDHSPSPRLLYEDKNAINNMSKEYAKALRKRYLKETPLIFSFLAAPENLELQRTYESVIDEFQLKIISKRKNYQSFDEVMEYLLDLLFNRDPVLRANKRLTRTVLFYMYWNCDIGEDEGAKAN